MDGNPLSRDSKVPSRLYGTARQPSLDEFVKICSNKTSTVELPLASSIQNNIPVYNLPKKVPPAEILNSIQDEWNYILLNGPGVFVVKHLYQDLALIDHTNTIYSSIIAGERASSTSKSNGDHFASAGENSRIWNSFSKHCFADSTSFASYYSNPWLASICEAWLGPMYRITAQVNIVHAGGAAQLCHRDYHLGFQAEEACGRFPRATQIASQFLTLQGAVAHTDMPLESGSTRLLPFSQKFEGGYMAYRKPEFRAFFLENFVSLPLEKGDGLFFNPALFHAAGENQTEAFSRSANLLQISSAFGKPMETIDTMPLIERCWDYLASLYKKSSLSPEVKALVGAIAEGYPFPTNLDKSPPAPSGTSPLSEQELLFEMLEKHVDKDQVLSTLRKMRENRKA